MTTAKSAIVTPLPTDHRDPTPNSIPKFPISLGSTKQDRFFVIGTADQEADLEKRWSLVHEFGMSRDPEVVALEKLLHENILAPIRIGAR